MVTIWVLSAAHAQTTATGVSAPLGFDAHGFDMAPLDADPRDPYIVQRPGGFSQADWFAAALFEYARAPLVRVTEAAGEQRVVPIVDNLLAANVSAGVAPFERLRFDVEAPIYGLSTGEDYLAQGPAMGDLRVGTMIVPVRPDPLKLGGGGFGLGVVGQVLLPTGTPDRYLGTGGYGGLGKLALTYEFPRVTLTADGGVQFNPEIQDENLNGSDEALAGFAVGVLANDEFGFTLEGHTEPSLFPAPPAEGQTRGPLPPAEALLSLRYASHSGALWTVGVAAGLTDGPGVAQYRLVLGGGYGHRPTAASMDVDTIGVLRASDLCPLETETHNGWKDDDGCPDRLGSLQIDVKYRTESRAADTEIIGPTGTQTLRIGPQGLTLDAVPGTAFTVKAKDGCLAGIGNAVAGEVGTALVVDMQPVYDSKVRVEVVGPTDTPLGGALVAWRSEHPECVPVGTAIADTTGAVRQEVASGKHSLVVTASGHNVVEQPVEVLPGDDRLVRVKLAASKIVLEKKEIKILEKVQFDTGKAVVKPPSYPLLNEVAAVILSNPEIGRVEVGGHTDNKGSDELNLRLSQNRANAVKDYLVGQGVPLSRLVAVGYGETRPIDTNKTEAGREANRRVEFQLIDQQQTPGGAR